MDSTPSGGTNNNRAIVQYTNNWLGALNWGGGTIDNYLNGYLDDFMIFNKVLSNSEVLSVYNLQSQTGSPIIPRSCSPSCSGSTPYGHCTPSGAAVCCGAGTYFVEGYSSTCEPCPVGTYGLGNLASCTPCAAGLNSPAGASACSTSYPVYALVADWIGGGVRKVDVSTSEVKTLVSSIAPTGVAVSRLGDFALVTSYDRNKVYKINIASSTYTTIAGGASSGSTDGTGTAALLNGPVDIKISPDATYALFSEFNIHAIRKVSLLDGSVVRIAGTLSAAYSEGSGTSIGLNKPTGIDISADGSFALVGEYDGNRVRKITLTGGGFTSTLLAGSSSAAAGTSGSTNGIGAAARFSRPQGVVISSDMTFALVVDRGNELIRKVLISTGEVTTLTTTGVTLVGATMVGIALSALEDAFYVTGNGNAKFYKITYPAGVCSVFAGSGTAGTADNAVGTSAQFNNPYNMAMWRCSILGYGMYASSTSCTQCPAGRYGSGNGLCTPCPMGTYSTAVGIKSAAE